MKRLSGAERVSVEQCIARGASNHWLMDAYDLTYRQLWLIKYAMTDEGAATTDPSKRGRQRQVRREHMRRKRAA